MAAADKENSEYSAAIAEGDAKFNLQQYEEARILYLKAGNLKPKEQYPKDRISEIEQMILERNTKQADFNQLIEAGDRLMETKEYDKAKEKFELALGIFPNEQYPTDKLKEISALLLAEELAVQEAYNLLLTDADLHFSKKEYPEAKLKYQNALKYKPFEEYPVQKIAEIDRLVTDLEALQTNYSNLITDADRLFKAREYQEAKMKYIEASGLFPEEQYPKTKIEEINLIYKAESERMQQQYDKAIADADKFYSAGVFDQALDSYRVAASVKPDEAYPEQMIGKILKTLDENAVRDILNSTITIENNDQKKLPFDPILVSDRKNSLIYIKAKNTADVEFKVVMSYGKGPSKNGGYILPIPAGGDQKEFIIPIGKQYTWFTEDNDWISLIPQGGSVEVSIIKITKGQ
jgi:tetratricopeptide (TPR) repeat protein